MTDAIQIIDHSDRVEQLLDPFREALGGDFEAYRGHVYRTITYAMHRSCQRKVSFNRPALRSTYDQIPISLFQNVTRDHPTRSDDVCPVSTLASKC